MANSKKLKLTTFKFKPFSDKQMKVLNWWTEKSPVNDMFMCIADGSVRSGKSISMSLSFVLFMMNTFNQQNAAMAGKSVGSFRRNILVSLKQMLMALDYEIIEHRSENYLEIIKGDVTNYFYVFGAKDESSQDLIQGITLAGLLIDEVALIPESFYNQATARLSIEGAKCFMNCNPSSPHHWFYKNVLKKLREKDGLYIHFTMDDNLSLSEEVKNRYKKMYSGVFAKRYVEGKWVVADGLIYDMFNKKEHVIKQSDIPYEDIIDWCISCDIGTANPTAFLLIGKTVDNTLYVCKEYYFDGRAAVKEEDGNPEAQKTDLDYVNDLRDFINEETELTQRTYRQIVVVVDPSASSFKLQARRFHMKTKNAINDVLTGIRTVSTYIGQNKLFICESCDNLIRELQTYVWDEKAQIRGVDAPLKRDDHCVDSLRYGCMHMQPKSKIGDATRIVGF